MRTLSLLSLALVGCSDAARTDVTQLGNYTLPVHGVRTEQPATDWKVIEQQLRELGIATTSSVIEFLPVMGRYPQGERKFRTDNCGVNQDALIALDHDNNHFSKRFISYRKDYLENGTVVVPGVPCDLKGHVYRCQAASFAIEWEDFDARVFIQNDDYGNWDAATDDKYLAVSPFYIKCDGKDCDQEPAKSIEGLISNPMPCGGMEVHEFTLQP